MRIYSRGKTRGGRVGGFPEPKRAIRAFSRLGSATNRLIIHGYFDVEDRIM